MRPQIAVIFCLPLILTGCTLSPTASPSPDAGLSIQGVVHGGNQPIVGAQVYLLAANTGGYGGAGIAPSSNNLSASKLSGSGYVVTGSGGIFTLSDYSCTPNTQLYLYAVGGNPGLPGTVNNTAAGLLAVLGNCPSTGNFLTPPLYIVVNEVSTIAAAYAFAGFATDATHVSSSGSALAQIGIQNAFANAANLANLSSGTALAATTNGSNGIVPQGEINALADILATCINTDPTTDPTPCNTLLNAATSDGTPTGTVPTDTATAAINIAHNPGANVGTLFGLIPGTGAPFSTGISQPYDFTLGIQFSGGGLNDPYAVALDGSGNVWAGNNGNTSVTELSSTGVPISPSNGYTATSMNDVFALAIDPSGDAWVTDFLNKTVTEFSGNNRGTVLSPTGGDTASSLNDPYAIAIDGSGNPWITNYGGSHGVTEWISSGSNSYSDSMSHPISIAIDGTSNVWIADNTNSDVVEFSKTGTLLSSPKYSGGGLNVPYAIAIDHAGNAWIANVGGIGASNISELLGVANGTQTAGTPLSPSGGYTAGGIDSPYAIAIDGAGNVWAANFGGSSVSELSNSGAAISPSTGYTGGVVSSPDAIAADGSGDVWVANSNGNLNELIGAAAPVVTPLSVGVKNNTLGTRP